MNKASDAVKKTKQAEFHTQLQMAKKAMGIMPVMLYNINFGIFVDHEHYKKKQEKCCN